MDQTTALRKALQDACPAKDDPYYRLFYPHKMRELKLWQRKGLWPLSKPKDFEHDTGCHDTVEVCTEVLNRVLTRDAGAPLQTFLSIADLPENEDRVDTLEFDPVEVAKIIESYEQDPASFTGNAAGLAESCPQEEIPTGSVERAYADRPVPLRLGLVEDQRVAYVPETEGDRVIQDFFEGVQPGGSPTDSGSPESARTGARDTLLPRKLDQGTLDELLTMLAWWKQHKERLAPSTTPVHLMPAFLSDRLVTKRIRMNTTLWEAGEKAAKQQPEVSGGTLSGLLQFLLWKHLGSTDTPLKK